MKNTRFSQLGLSVLLCLVACLFSCQNDDDDFVPMMHEGDMELLTMADLKQFYEDGITVVTGGLDVGSFQGVDDSDITSLEYLSRLERVEGKLRISNLEAPSLKGLDNLVSVEEIQLRYLELENLNHLSSLQSGDLAILSLYSLVSLEGLDAKESHMDGLFIAFCTSLPDFTGLEFLETAGNINLTGNAINSLKGLDNLQEVNGGFRLGYSEFLTDLRGLSSLRSVSGEFLIEVLGSFESFQGLNANLEVGALGLSNTTQVRDLNGLPSSGNVEALSLMNNSGLTSLDGLDQFIGLKTLNLLWNENLNSLSALSSLSGLEDLSLGGMPSLQNLQGLENLSQLNNLTIRHLYGLTDLSALSNLTQLDKLWLEYASALPNLNGLQNLQSIDELYVEQADNLTDISGLTDCTINEQLTFAKIPNLVLDQLPLSVADAMGRVIFFEVPGMTSVAGLENLTSADLLEISAMENIENLDPLSQVTAVNNLGLSRNPKLSNLDGLSALVTSGSSFIIMENTQLTDFCGLTNLLGSTQFSGRYTVENNAFNPSVSDIRSGNCKED